MPGYRKETIDQPYIECGNPSLQKIKLLRTVVESRSQMNPSIGVLLYRQESTRKILNHDETLSMLKTKYPDLEWVVFDKLSPEDTAALFARAKLIVGPHGAGFTNMIFAPKGVHIVEFISMEAPNVCYWHMSEMIGNHHSMIPCYTKDTQFMIDTDEVSNLLPSI
jgi:capsular polysaccharide biosynthesis protein